MKGDWFTKEQAGFWGSLAAAVAAYFKYKTASLKRKEIDMSTLGTENIKKVLGGVNAAGGEIAKLAKDGIQAKDAQTLIEDILTSSELRSQVANIVNCMKPAIEEAKDIDILEGIDVAKFEYEAVKSIIETLKK